MALTYTPVFALTATGNTDLTSGSANVAAILDKEQRAYYFIPTPTGNAGSTVGTMAPSYAFPTNWNGIAITTGTNATAIFPSINSAFIVPPFQMAVDPVTGNQQVGQVVVNLIPPVGDVVNSSSVLTYRLDPSAVLLIVSGTVTGGNAWPL